MSSGGGSARARSAQCPRDGNEPRFAPADPTILPAEYRISRRTRALNRLSVAGDVGMFKACREMTLERWLSAFGIEKEQKAFSTSKVQL